MNLHGKGGRGLLIRLGLLLCADIYIYFQCHYLRIALSLHIAFFYLIISTYLCVKRYMWLSSL